MEVIISVIENQPGETIARHIHHGEEAFYVLQGATLETADGKQITLPAGASAINPRDVAHAGLKVLGTTPFKYLAVHIVDKGASFTTILRNSESPRPPRLAFGALPLPVPRPQRVWFCPGWRGNEKKRFHQSPWWRSRCLAAFRAGAANGNAGHRISGRRRPEQRGAAP